MSIADELITRGWTQGSYDDHQTGKVCLVGAACHALLGMSWDEADFVAIDAAISPVVSLLGVNTEDEVTIWNDEADRTFDEVLRIAKLADEILDR